MGERSLLPFGTARVAGPSMVPTLLPGDRLLVRYGGIARPGDLVVARHPVHPERAIVKRAVRRSPEGRWWLGSDNAFAGGDSSVFGEVGDDLILGRVLIRLWPLRRSRAS